MLWTILLIILAAWVLGLIFNLFGGLIHILLVVAVVVFLVKMLRKPRVTP